MDDPRARPPPVRAERPVRPRRARGGAVAAGLLTLIRRIHELVADGSQFVIATHSPILLAYPGALIYELTGDGPVPTAYGDTDHFRMTRAFLDAPERFLRELL